MAGQTPIVEEKGGKIVEPKGKGPSSIFNFLRDIGEPQFGPGSQEYAQNQAETLTHKQLAKYLAPGESPDYGTKAPPTTQQSIDQLLSTYMGELNQLGPEYGAEMEYLKPYLNPQPETMSQVTTQAQQQASPTGNTAVNAADAAVAKAIEGQPGPGFGGLYAAGKEFEGSIPYSELLSTLLQAGKNEVLGYSTVPNLTNIQTKNWPQNLQEAYGYAVQGIGANPATGLFNSANVAAQKAQQPAPNIPNVTGGGNA